MTNQMTNGNKLVKRLVDACIAMNAELAMIEVRHGVTPEFKRLMVELLDATSRVLYSNRDYQK